MQMAAPGWLYHARQGLPLALRAERQSSMARYLRHFALVMILQERGLTPRRCKVSQRTLARSGASMCKSRQRCEPAWLSRPPFGWCGCKVTVRTVCRETPGLPSQRALRGAKKTWQVSQTCQVSVRGNLRCGSRSCRRCRSSFG